MSGWDGEEGGRREVFRAVDGWIARMQAKRCTSTWTWKWTCTCR